MSLYPNHARLPEHNETRCSATSSVRESSCVANPLSPSLANFHHSWLPQQKDGDPWSGGVPAWTHPSLTPTMLVLSTFFLLLLDMYLRRTPFLFCSLRPCYFLPLLAYPALVHSTRMSCTECPFEFQEANTGCSYSAILIYLLSLRSNELACLSKDLSSMRYACLKHSFMKLKLKLWMLCLSPHQPPTNRQ